MGLSNGNKTGMQSLLRAQFIPFSSQLFLIAQPDKFPLHNPAPYHHQAHYSNRPTDLSWVSSETVTGKLHKGKRLAHSDTGFKYKVRLGLGRPESALRTLAGKKKGCWEGNINRNCSNVIQSRNVFNK